MHFEVRDLPTTHSDFVGAPNRIDRSIGPSRIGRLGPNGADKSGLSFTPTTRDLIVLGAPSRANALVAPSRANALGAPPYMQQLWVGRADTTSTVVMSARPTRAGIDPCNKRVDRDRSDTAKAVVLGGLLIL